MAIKTIEETNLELEKLVDLFRQLPDSNQQEQLPKPLIPIMNIGAKSIVNDINNILYSAIEERIIEVNAIKIKTELDINSKKSEEQSLLSSYLKHVLDVKEVNPKTEYTFIKNLSYNTTSEGTSANTITFKLTDLNKPNVELDLGDGNQPQYMINLQSSEIKSIQFIKTNNNFLSPIFKFGSTSKQFYIDAAIPIEENYVNFKGMKVHHV
ncbi:MAG: hypothetical protein KKH40_06595, partial [Nanoarchaeota archaeon]|nr:hypothetical protein [Nanoarchaeota archaeon]